MWKFLLDPAVQGMAFLLVAAVLAFVAWDLYEDSRDPRAQSFQPRRAKPRDAGAPPRRPVYVEPSVEIWSDAQGQTRGRVLRGPARGARLEDMTQEQCEAQTAYAREHDPPAAVALESYMRWRFARRQRYEARPEGELSRTQALAELGLSEGASEAEIHAAYRRLIKTHHPDHGGSHAKAARLNRAKDLLAQ